MKMRITKHKNSTVGLEQVIVTEGKNHIRFNIWKDNHYGFWNGKSVGIIEPMELLPCDTRDELIERIERIAQEYFNKLKEEK
jgi:hypothetical protein